jgi:CubicO group peptidase (beta-lactamase class C family)
VRQRGHGEYILWAQAGQEIAFTLGLQRVGKSTTPQMSVDVVAPSGERASLPKMTGAGEKSYSFPAKQAGPYRIVCEAGTSTVQVVSCNLPVGLYSERAPFHLLGPAGDVYFCVPAGVLEFGVRVSGGGEGESVKAVICDAAGAKNLSPVRDEKDNIDGHQFLFHRPPTADTEIWRLQLVKPSQGVLEDYYVQLQGIPPILATRPEALLGPALVPSPASGPLPRLQVSENRQFLVTEEGNDRVLVLDAVTPESGSGERAIPPRAGAADKVDYFPPPDAQGGWRTLKDAGEIRRVAGMDVGKLDEAFEVAAASTKNGGVLVVHHGWLVYERYFGRGRREATPNLASCGKSFTSIAIGILMAERPELFPEGLDQKVFTPKYLPPEAFPLSDPAMAEIKLGQLLAFSAGIRGNNPCSVRGKEVTIDPPGPDGWPSIVDAIALGKRDHVANGRRYSAATLWCPPGGGYSYATASIHIASMIVRHVAGVELQEYLQKHVAEPLGWGRWGYGYKYAKEVTHTPGGGGITLRATDMLRFGYLLLHEGRWGDRQLVPAAYVRHCARQSPYNPHYAYSLQFNVNTDGHYPEYPRDAFWKSGSGAHMLYVVPSLDLVVWKLAGRDGQYEQRDTGVLLAPEIAQGSESRRNWKPTIDERRGQRLVLSKVIEAITDSPRPQVP